jgi:hypothetical protein
LPAAKALLALVCAVPLLHLFGFYSIPFWPFTTTGRIYVDSPEVYTRERLVNDRYEQDYWLRKRLEQLNEPEKLSLIVGTKGAAVKVSSADEADAAGAADGEGVVDAASGGPAAPADDRRLSFDQEFRVASGIRDTIRQQLLENMLDDRHDLIGNSVFGLKFDTTVIPGTNTLRRAFVHVQVNVAPFAARNSGESPPFQCGGSGKAVSATGTEPSTPGESYQEDMFENWTKDIARRLNLAEDFLYDNLAPSCKGQDPTWSDTLLYDSLTARTLETVLGIPQERFWLLLRQQKREIASQECIADVEADRCCKAIVDAELSDDELSDLAGRIREGKKQHAGDGEKLDETKAMASNGGDDGNPSADDQESATACWGALDQPKLSSEERLKFAPKPFQGPVVLPDPWSRYFLVYREPFKSANLFSAEQDDRCQQRVWFEVVGLTESFWIRKSVLREPPVASAPSGSSDDPMVSTAQEGVVSGPTEQTPHPPGDVTDADDLNRLETRRFPIPAPASASADRVASPAERPLDSGQTGLVEWGVFVTRPEYELLRIWRENVLPRYTLSEALLESALKDSKRRCPQTPSSADCERFADGYHRLEVKSGFWNFRDYLAQRNLYPYAIFPRDDVVGVISDSQQQLSTALPGAGLLDLVRRNHRSGTESVLVGYGQGGGSKWNRLQEKNTIDFGWVISAREDMQPTQKSQLALVSVPAWTDRLNLCIRVGWLDRWGGVHEDDELEFFVPITVPPNLEAFDSIFREDAQVTLGPTIIDSQMDQEIYIRTGDRAGRDKPPVKILIPGTRLWRSAQVTLGAQPASRITVLPNMEGIIAEFDRIDPPYAVFTPSTENDAARGGTDGRDWKCKHSKALDDDGLGVRPVRLRVWTSEGVAQVKRPICLIYDPANVVQAPKGREDPDKQAERPPATLEADKRETGSPENTLSVAPASSEESTETPPARGGEPVE